MGTVISWLIVGLVAGAVARLILPGKQGGGWGSALVLGLIGAIVGGFLFGLFGGDGISGTFADPWSWGSFFTSVVGAIIFTLIWGALRGRKES